MSIEERIKIEVTQLWKRLAMTLIMLGFKMLGRKGKYRLMRPGQQEVEVAADQDRLAEQVMAVIRAESGLAADLVEKDVREVLAKHDCHEGIPWQNGNPEPEELL